jgi:radial spoke head protein 1
MSDYDSPDADLDPVSRIGIYNGPRNEKGQRHGFGEATLRNGDEYVGEYCEGKRHGFGKYKFKNGARYCDCVLIERI